MHIDDEIEKESLDGDSEQEEELGTGVYGVVCLDETVPISTQQNPRDDFKIDEDDLLLGFSARESNLVDTGFIDHDLIDSLDEESNAWVGMKASVHSDPDSNAEDLFSGLDIMVGTYDYSPYLGTQVPPEATVRYNEAYFDQNEYQDYDEYYEEDNRTFTDRKKHIILIIVLVILIIAATFICVKIITGKSANSGYEAALENTLNINEVTETTRVFNLSISSAEWKSGDMPYVIRLQKGDSFNSAQILTIEVHPSQATSVELPCGDWSLITIGAPVTSEGIMMDKLSGDFTLSESDSIYDLQLTASEAPTCTTNMLDLFRSIYKDRGYSETSLNALIELAKERYNLNPSKSENRNSNTNSNANSNSNENSNANGNSNSNANSNVAPAPTPGNENSNANANTNANENFNVNEE